jgi:L-alanine-DL-glutamate epimerase-like enolase superfamily enzyme
MMTRRDVIFSLPLMTRVAMANGPRIRSVEAIPIVYPVTSFFRFFPKPERPAIFVKITTDDGSVGWGQSVPVPSWSYETPESALNAIRDYLAPPLIGRDPFDIAGAHALMNRAISPSFSTGMPIAKAGIDLALYDLTGRMMGKHFAARVGRESLAEIPLSWTVNVRGLEEAEKLVAEGKERGYKHFNLKVAPDLKFDLELCRIVRKLTPGGFLWIDANGGYDPATALTAAPKFAELGVDVFEQPVPANRLGALRDLKRQGALPILLDEGVVSSQDLIEFIRLGALDGVAMKPARTAGLWDAIRQVEILRDAGLLFLGSGLTDPDVSLAASLALYAAFGLKYPAALNGPQFLAGSFLKQPIEVRNGAARVPTGNGLGVEVDESKVRGGKA